jgi:hypothetical protein
MSKPTADRMETSKNCRKDKDECKGEGMMWSFGVGIGIVIVGTIIGNFVSLARGHGRSMVVNQVMDSLMFLMPNDNDFPSSNISFDNMNTEFPKM